MQLLSQFLLRLSFGLSVGMAITSPQQVSSGFFRNHLYVTLGLTTLAELVISRLSQTAAGFAAAAAILSFFGAASWLYEAHRAGRSILWLVAACSIAAAIVSQPEPIGTGEHAVLRMLAIPTSGLVLGVTLAAMLLGHWYLNAPGMALAPLRRLLAAAAIAVALQALVSAVGLAIDLSTGADVSIQWLLFNLLRWSFGIFGVLGLLWMAWQTLKIPNTQSATGILYVAVIGAFVGELTAALLSAESAFPL